MSHVNQPNPTEQALSPTLSILPLKNRVLLPSGAMKLTLTRPRDVALVDHALASGNVASGSLFVGVVPLRRDEGLDTESGTASALGGDLPDDVVDLRERLHDVGVAARIVQVARTENRGGGTRAYTLLLEGRCRFELSRLVSVDPFLVASVTQLDSLSTGSLTDNAGTSQGVSSSSPVDAELAAMAASFKLRARELVDKLEQRKGHARRLKSMLTNAPAHRIADLFVAAFEDDFENRIELLAMTCPKQRMAASLALIEKQLTSLRVNADVARRVQGKLSKTQREFILRQQMAAIKKELGEGRDDNKDEEGDLDVLLAKVRGANPPADTLKAAETELRKLRKMTEQAPGFGSTRQWIECIASLPWSVEAAASHAGPERAIGEARGVLDKKHYGLDRVKDRIVEYLAVRRLRPDAKPPILCFLGPPGVGKTTLARSIAEVLSRPFQRISLGGVRDEADIRGHRRTYVASMPGRLISGLKRVGVKDPVILLDELDKMGADSRGDPAAALLEVLDPELNDAFVDHYLGVPFDLSRVTFLATANDARTIPGPLRDRMEMIDVPGYTAEEKLHIAMQHVVPRVLEEHGLLTTAGTPRLSIGAEAIETVVKGYTREAGVRGLTRCLASLCRAAAVHAAGADDGSVGVSLDSNGVGAKDSQSRNGVSLHPAFRAMANAMQSSSKHGGVPTVTQELISKVLGPPRYESANSDLRFTDAAAIPGVVAGLSWTPAGGDLMYIEAAVMPGKGDLQLTGQLGDVIKESARIALSWVQSHAFALGLSGGSIPGVGKGERGNHTAGNVGGGMYAASASADTQGSYGRIVANGIDSLPPLGGEGLLRGRSVHIHLPQGAIPKDGPSAGVAMCCALVSLFSGRPVRSDVAMTGEVSLRGLVLPVGGLKEKLIAAHVNGIKKVLIPFRNAVDVEHDVPQATKLALEIVPCATMAEVLAHAFQGGYGIVGERARM